MIDENHIEKFISQLSDKGYTGKFFAPGIANEELRHTLKSYLGSRLKDNHLSKAFPFWISTITDGNLLSKERTVCMMKVQYSPDDGLVTDELKVIRWNSLKERTINELAPIVVKSIRELPTCETINSLVRSNNRDRRRTNRRKL